MINIIGEFFGPSGYANHCRYLANELNKLVPCKITTNLPQGFERLVNDQELEMIKRQPDYETNLIITHPLYWRVNCDAKRNIVYLIWEGNKVPKWIAQECANKNIKKIIVPSKHTYDAYMNYFKEDPMVENVAYKLEIIPHGVDLNTYYPIINNPHPEVNVCQGGGETVVIRDDTVKSSQAKETTEESIDKETQNPPAEPFRFLSNKGFRNMEDRGGVQYLIKAYLEEFDGSDTELIIKINPAYGIPNIEQLFPGISNRKDIKFITDNYTPKQLNELYNSCDVYVSSTRAESFNLPIAESAACGKMCLVTGFGGQTDIVIDKQTGLLLDYQLVPVEHELEFESVSWAVPSHKDLMKKLRWCYDNKESVVNMGENAMKNIKEYTWESTANKIYSLL